MLGVTADQILSCEAHIFTVVRKWNSILFSLYKIKHHLIPEARQLLIQCHAFPHILYCLSVCSGAAVASVSPAQSEKVVKVNCSLLWC